MINTAARGFELYSYVFDTQSLLTVDFIMIGRIDTKRMREELLPDLTYKTYKDGLSTL